MSSKKGDCQRKRAQKYKNTFAFKNDLYDKSTKIKNLNALSINEVCTRCHDQIEWKIKYRKYKALTKPATCNICHERNVKKAYHVLCRNCAIANEQCAKCLVKSGEGVEIIPPEPEAEEKLRLKVEMKQLIKSLPERKRRTFLRFMKGKKKPKDSDGEEIETEEQPNVRRTRDELLEKIEKLKGADDEFYEGVVEDDDDNESWDTDGFSSGGEEEEEEC